jgi:hypothetical protein
MIPPLVVADATTRGAALPTHRISLLKGDKFITHENPYAKKYSCDQTGFLKDKVSPLSSWYLKPKTSRTQVVITVSLKEINNFTLIVL